MQQVLWNLFFNAVKFTPAGGRVRIAVERVGNQVHVTVSDTGRGIAEEFLPHVFERFRQADSSPARTHGGLGLGLAIVKHLTEAHGGTVSADSPGTDRGATFVVRLPLRAVAPPVSVPPDRSIRRARPTMAGARALIVDDEADARELIRFVLEAEGADVTAAESAGVALELFGRHRFDVLVADIGMPGQDGHSLIRAIRRLPASSGGKTPAIAVTAFASLREREDALAAGYDWHLAKPVEPAQLIAAVSSTLKHGSIGSTRKASRKRRPKKAVSRTTARRARRRSG